MTLSYLSFYRQYFQSPKIVIHQMNITFKIYIIFIYLIIFPYYRSLSLIKIISILFILLKLTNRSEIIYSIFFKYISFNIINMIGFVIGNYYSALYTQKSNYITLFIPLTMNFLLYSQPCNYILFVTCKVFVYLFPEFFLRILAIKLSYIILIQLLFTTTKYESVILFVLSHYKILKNRDNLSLNINHLLISFCFHTLERIVYNFNILYLAIKINYKSLIFTYNDLYIYLIILISFLYNIWKDIYEISSILWSRKIFYTQFHM